jgi:hypothetical protein
MKPLCLSVILGSALLTSVCVTQAAISIEGFTSLTNDRFANDASFIMDGYDLSGVALADNGRWVTMISKNVFLSANHFFPSNGTSVTFYGSNDASGVSATRTVLSSQRIGSSDVRIGVLDNPLGGNFTFYDYATEDATSLAQYASTPYALQNAYLFGRSQTSFSVSQDMAVGRNVLDRWFDSASVDGTTDDAAGSTVDSPGDLNYVSYEAALGTGDSGAPMFVGDGMGGLTMVGLNWFVGTAGEDAINGQTYLGNYDADILAYIEAHPVPEPKFAALLIGCFAGMLAVRRRARQA